MIKVTKKWCRQEPRRVQRRSLWTSCSKRDPRDHLPLKFKKRSKKFLNLRISWIRLFSSLETQLWPRCSIKRLILKSFKKSPQSQISLSPSRPERKDLNCLSRSTISQTFWVKTNLLSKINQGFRLSILGTHTFKKRSCTRRAMLLGAKWKFLKTFQSTGTNNLCSGVRML